MKKIIYLLLIVSFSLLSSNVFAFWRYVGQGYNEDIWVGPAELCLETEYPQSLINTALNNGYPYQLYADSGYTSSGKAFCERSVYHWLGGGPFTTPTVDAPVYNAIYNDEQCQSAFGGSYQIPGTTAGNIDSVSAGACTLSSVGVAVCTSGGCFAEWDAVSSGVTNQPSTPLPSDSEPLPDYLTETTDPSSCPGGYVGMGGSTYCVDQGAIDDGSISTIGGDIQYPPPDTDDDGVPDANDPTPGTGETVGGGSDGSGGSTGGTTTEPGGSYGGGGQFGDPSGSAGDGDGDGTQDGACSVFLGDAVCDWMFGVPNEPVQPALPVQTITAANQTVEFESGLSNTATCPPPETVSVAFGSFAKTVEIPYTNICTFAEMIRGLVIAAAYMAAAFITYRGVVA